MKLEFTKNLPNKEGYYWWTNFGEHTPVVLEVKKDYNSGAFWACNEEFSFKIERVNLKKLKKENEKYELEKVDGHHYGEELWCYIPNPHLPNGKQVKPDCY